MGAYVFINAALSGFFVCAATHCTAQWWQSRRESILLVFSLHCLLCALLGVCVVNIASATTIASMNTALSWRTTIGLLQVTTTALVLGRLTDVSARWYVNSVATFFLLLAAINLLVLPLNGTATAISRFLFPWGEALSIPVRPPAAAWVLPVYFLVATVPVFGFVVARRLWAHDRIGGILVGLASAGGLVASLIAVFADAMQWNLPYCGVLPCAFWIAVISLQLAREYARRGDRLVAVENRFRAIFDQTFQFIGLMTVDGTLIEANRTALEFAGIRAEDVLGKPFWNTPWWSHSIELQEQLRQGVQAAARGEFVRFEASHPGADGKIRHVDFSLKPVCDASGRIVLLIPEGHDITERKSAEESLREYSEFNRQIIDSATDGLIVLDRDFRYQVWNPGMEQISGLSAENVIGKRPHDLFPFLKEAGILSLLERALSGETVWSPDFPYKVASSGREGWTSQCMGPLRSVDGDIIGVLITVRDLTDRVRAEKSLRESETRLRRKDAELRRLIESNMIGIVFWTADGGITGANDYFLNVIGYHREDLAAGKLHWIDLTPPEFRHLDDAALVELNRRGVCSPFEKEYIHKNGSRVPILVGAASYDGEPVRGVAFVLDLTERKRLEAQFQQAQKMEAIGNLAGGISHDFNNLITVIIGYCEFLHEQVRQDDAIWQSIGEIHNAANRAALLTRQLLAFSRRQLLAPKVLNMNAIIREIETMLRRLIGEDVVLTIDLDPELRPVKVDPGQIEQILMNLAVNARDAMPQGGRLAIKTENVQLNAATCERLSDLRPGTFATLTVSDTGTGMDEATQAHVFEPFFTTKGVGQGTGLGLATVHGIVTQSGGHIELDSEPGSGTRFRIFLPNVDEPVAVDESPLKPIAIPSGTETILLVEDEDAVRILVRQILKSCGYNVLEAANGLVALEIAEHNPQIKLLVSDVVMPFLGGRELAEQILTLCPGCRVLFMSGHTDDAVVRHGVLQAQFMFLQKPFTSLRLAQVVREVLERSNS